MCVKPPPQVTTMSAVTDKEQLKAICIAFKIYFESTHSRNWNKASRKASKWRSLKRSSSALVA